MGSARPPRSRTSPSSATSTGPQDRADALGVWAPSPASPWPRPSSGVLSGCGAGAPSSGSLLFVPWLPHGAALRTETSDRGSGRIDWIGIAVGALALATASFGSFKGRSRATSLVDRPVLRAAVVLVRLLLRERRVRRPILDFSLFRKMPSPARSSSPSPLLRTFSIFFFTACTSTWLSTHPHTRPVTSSDGRRLIVAPS